jgi:hypothetical protein
MPSSPSLQAEASVALSPARTEQPRAGLFYVIAPLAASARGVAPFDDERRQCCLAACSVAITDLHSLQTMSAAS